MEEFVPVTKKKKKAAQVEKEFIKNWLAETQDDFASVMEQIKEKDPRTWAKLRVDVMKHTVPKTTDINHNIGMNKDIQDLMMLGMTAATSQLKGKTNAQDELEYITHYEVIQEPTELLSNEFNKEEED